MSMRDLKPGLYNKKNELIYTWNELISKNMLTLNRYNSNLSEINIKDNEAILNLSPNIESISLYANKFILHKIYIPENITFISTDILLNINDLEISKRNTSYKIVNEILYDNKNNILGYLQKNKRTDINIPNGTKGIHNSVFFEDKTLKNITLPDSINNIGANCFAYSRIKNIKLPYGLKKIPVGLFNNCKELETVTIPDNVEIICSSVFENCCNLKSIILPISIKKIGSNIFANCHDIKIKYMGSEEDFKKIENYKELSKRTIIYNYKKTLDELIAEGKNIREANRELRKQQEDMIK